MASFISEKLILEDISNFKKELDEDNIRFSVVILPLLRPYDEWQSVDKQSLESIVRILNQLRVRYYNLQPIFDELIKENYKIDDLCIDKYFSLLLS